MARLIACLTVLAGIAALAAAKAAPATSNSWQTVKCDRYKRAWSGTLDRLGTAGLGRAFLDHHEAFLASGCLAGRNVCPRSPEELRIANIMVVFAMNAGAASTFPPFACPR